MNKENVGLYDQSFEHDNCGIGAVVNIKGLKTYKTVDDALKIVEQLEHRAGKDAAGETGDGVGIVTQIPDEYFQKVIKDFTLPQKGHYGVGMFFMPQDEKVRLRVKKMFETVVKKEGLEFLGWRAVPTVPSVLGKKALDAMPYIVQVFIKKPHGVNCGLDFDRKLYQVRRIFEQSQFEDTYVCSLSSRTIVYKGMFLVQQLRLFFKDLQDKSYKSAIALVHSRFSTNTMPYLQEDNHIKKEMKIKTYYQILAYLHNHSFFMQHEEDAFFKKQYDDLFSLIQQRKNDYEELMREFEFRKFKSPAGWMLVLNYYRIVHYLNQAHYYLSQYQEVMKDKNEIRLSLTYNHFDKEHIFVSDETLISIDRMKINYCIYDLIDIFQNHDELYDSLPLLEYYLKEVKLLKEEKILMKCILSIVPQVQLNLQEEVNIYQMSKLICYLDGLQEIFKKLMIDEK